MSSLLYPELTIFLGGFRITQFFGSNPSIYKQYGFAGHEGLDIVPIGSDWSIYAPEDGKIVRDTDNPRDFSNYGNLMVLLSTDGKRAWWFAHNQENYVSIGQKVKKGDKLSKMGATGNVTGAHSHLGLREAINGVAINTNNGFKGFIDPLPVLEDMKGTMSDQYGNMVWKSTQHDKTVSALYPPEKDPRQTDSEAIVSVVNGYKSQATDLRNKLAIAEAEASNRVEQVGRLNEQLLNKEKDCKTQITALKIDGKTYNELEQSYLGRISQLQEQVNEVSKAKGSALIRVSVLEAELKEVKEKTAAQLRTKNLFILLLKSIFNFKGKAK